VAVSGTFAAKTDGVAPSEPFLPVVDRLNVRSRATARAAERMGKLMGFQVVREVVSRRRESAVLYGR
jgi:hypothetical protein